MSGKIRNNDVDAVFQDSISTRQKFENVKQAESSAIDCGSTCTGGCSTGCSSSCTGKCDTGCATTCKSGCGAHCANVCGACSGGCGSSCSSGCKGCTGSCNSTCSGQCATGCGYSCITTCNVNCGGDCAGVCMNGCRSGCTGSCVYTCSGTCLTQCTNICKGGCSTACSGGCKSGCGGCTGCTGCTGGCKGCNACTSGCTAACSGACTGCTSSCTAACGGCGSNCSGTCTGTSKSENYALIGGATQKIIGWNAVTQLEYPIFSEGDDEFIIPSGVELVQVSAHFNMKLVIGNHSVAICKNGVPITPKIPFSKLEEFVVTFNMVTDANSYIYIDLTGVSNYVVVSGDYLYYDIHNLTIDNQKCGIDLKCTDGNRLIDYSQTDQNGVSADPRTTSPYLNGGWYSRKIALPSGMIGKTIEKYWLVCEKEATATYKTEFRNIYIGDEDGLVRKSIVIDSFDDSISVDLKNPSECSGSVAETTKTVNVSIPPVVVPVEAGDGLSVYAYLEGTEFGFNADSTMQIHLLVEGESLLPS